MEIGGENELQRLDMTTLFKGNSSAAEDMFEKISEYGKATVYDKSGLIEAQKTMMSFGMEGEEDNQISRKLMLKYICFESLDFNYFCTIHF